LTYRQIIPQRTDLSTLILEIVDELAVLSILSSQYFLELKDWSIDGDSAVELKDILDCSEDVIAKQHF
jgi:hypothetical protein